MALRQRIEQAGRESRYIGQDHEFPAIRFGFAFRRLKQGIVPLAVQNNDGTIVPANSLHGQGSENTLGLAASSCTQNPDSAFPKLVREQYRVRSVSVIESEKCGFPIFTNISGSQPFHNIIHTLS